MSPELPGSVAACFVADAAHDLARSFANGGAVLDEGETHMGADAIRTWWRAAHARDRFQNEPLVAVAEGGRLTVRTRVTGDFPGGPARLRFAFDLCEDGIRRLETGA